MKSYMNGCVVLLSIVCMQTAYGYTIDLYNFTSVPIDVQLVKEACQDAFVLHIEPNQKKVSVNVKLCCLKGIKIRKSNANKAYADPAVGGVKTLQCWSHTFFIIERGGTDEDNPVFEVMRDVPQDAYVQDIKKKIEARVTLEKKALAVNDTKPVVVQTVPVVEVKQSAPVAMPGTVVSEVQNKEPKGAATTDMAVKKSGAVEAKKEKKAPMIRAIAHFRNSLKEKQLAVTYNDPLCLTQTFVELALMGQLYTEYTLEHEYDKNGRVKGKTILEWFKGVYTATLAALSSTKNKLVVITATGIDGDQAVVQLLVDMLVELINKDKYVVLIIDRNVYQTGTIPAYMKESLGLDEEEIITWDKLLQDEQESLLDQTGLTDADKVRYSTLANGHTAPYVLILENILNKSSMPMSDTVQTDANSAYTQYDRFLSATKERIEQIYDQHKRESDLYDLSALKTLGFLPKT